MGELLLVFRASLTANMPLLFCNTLPLCVWVDLHMCIHACWVGAGARPESWLTLWTPSSNLFAAHFPSAAVHLKPVALPLCVAAVWTLHRLCFHLSIIHEINSVGAPIRASPPSCLAVKSSSLQILASNEVSDRCIRRNNHPVSWFFKPWNSFHVNIRHHNRWLGSSKERDSLRREIKTFSLKQLFFHLNAANWHSEGKKSVCGLCYSLQHLHIVLLEQGFLSKNKSKKLHCRYSESRGFFFLIRWA